MQWPFINGLSVEEGCFWVSPLKALPQPQLTKMQLRASPSCFLNSQERRVMILGATCSSQHLKLKYSAIGWANSSCRKVGLSSWAGGDVALNSPDFPGNGAPFHHPSGNSSVSTRESDPISTEYLWPTFASDYINSHDYDSKCNCVCVCASGGGRLRKREHSWSKYIVSLILGLLPPNWKFWWYTY